MSQLSTKRINIYFITIVITLGGLLFGYDTGVINGTQFYFSKYFELTGALKGFIVSSALLGALAGAAGAGRRLDLPGQRHQKGGYEVAFSSRR